MSVAGISCLLFLLLLRVEQGAARGVLSIKLLSFENPKGRTYEGQCCDPSPLDGDMCHDKCDYVMRLIIAGLGRANDHVFLFHRPLKYDSNDLHFQEHGGKDLTLTVLFDKWPAEGHVKMNAFFYDYDDFDHTTSLVDWFETELSSDGKAWQGHTDIVVNGNRQQDKTRLVFQWSRHCAGGLDGDEECLPPPPEWKFWPGKSSADAESKSQQNSQESTEVGRGYYEDEERVGHPLKSPFRPFSTRADDHELRGSSSPRMGGESHAEVTKRPWFRHGGRWRRPFVRPSERRSRYKDHHVRMSSFNQQEDNQIFNHRGGSVFVEDPKRRFEGNRRTHDHDGRENSVSDSVQDTEKSQQKNLRQKGHERTSPNDKENFPTSTQQLKPSTQNALDHSRPRNFHMKPPKLDKILKVFIPDNERSYHPRFYRPPTAAENSNNDQTKSEKTKVQRVQDDQQKRKDRVGKTTTTVVPPLKKHESHDHRQGQDDRSQHSLEPQPQENGVKVVKPVFNYKSSPQSPSNAVMTPTTVAVTPKPKHGESAKDEVYTVPSNIFQDPYLQHKKADVTSSPSTSTKTTTAERPQGWGPLHDNPSETWLPVTPASVWIPRETYFSRPPPAPRHAQEDDNENGQGSDASRQNVQTETREKPLQKGPAQSVPARQIPHVKIEFQYTLPKNNQQHPRGQNLVPKSPDDDYQKAGNPVRTRVSFDDNRLKGVEKRLKETKPARKSTNQETESILSEETEGSNLKQQTRVQEKPSSRSESHISDSPQVKGHKIKESTKPGSGTQSAVPLRKDTTKPLEMNPLLKYKQQQEWLKRKKIDRLRSDFSEITRRGEQLQKPISVPAVSLVSDPRDITEKRERQSAHTSSKLEGHKDDEKKDSNLVDDKFAHVRADENLQTQQSLSTEKTSTRKTPVITNHQYNVKTSLQGYTTVSAADRSQISVTVSSTDSLVTSMRTVPLRTMSSEEGMISKSSTETTERTIHEKSTVPIADTTTANKLSVHTAGGKPHKVANSDELSNSRLTSVSKGSGRGRPDSQLEKGDHTTVKTGSSAVSVVRKQSFTSSSTLNTLSPLRSSGLTVFSEDRTSVTNSFDQTQTTTPFTTTTEHFENYDNDSGMMRPESMKRIKTQTFQTPTQIMWYVTTHPAYLKTTPRYRPGQFIIQRKDDKVESSKDISPGNKYNFPKDKNPFNRPKIQVEDVKKQEKNEERKRKTFNTKILKSRLDPVPSFTDPKVLDSLTITTTDRPESASDHIRKSPFASHNHVHPKAGSSTNIGKSDQEQGAHFAYKQNKYSGRVQQINSLLDAYYLSRPWANSVETSLKPSVHRDAGSVWSELDSGTNSVNKSARPAKTVDVTSNSKNQQINSSDLEKARPSANTHSPRERIKSVTSVSSTDAETFTASRRESDKRTLALDQGIIKEENEITKAEQLRKGGKKEHEFRLHLKERTKLTVNDTKWEHSFVKNTRPRKLIERINEVSDSEQTKGDTDYTDHRKPNRNRFERPVGRKNRFRDPVNRTRQPAPGNLPEKNPFLNKGPWRQGTLTPRKSTGRVSSLYKSGINGTKINSSQGSHDRLIVPTRLQAPSRGGSKYDEGTGKKSPGSTITDTHLQSSVKTPAEESDLLTNRTVSNFQSQNRLNSTSGMLENLEKRRRNKKKNGTQTFRQHTTSLVPTTATLQPTGHSKSSPSSSVGKDANAGTTAKAFDRFTKTLSPLSTSSAILTTNSAELESTNENGQNRVDFDHSQRSIPETGSDTISPVATTKTQGRKPTSQPEMSQSVEYKTKPVASTVKPTYKTLFSSTKLPTVSVSSAREKDKLETDEKNAKTTSTQILLSTRPRELSVNSVAGKPPPTSTYQKGYARLSTDGTASEPRSLKTKLSTSENPQPTSRVDVSLKSTESTQSGRNRTLKAASGRFYTNTPPNASHGFPVYHKGAESKRPLLDLDASSKRPDLEKSVYIDRTDKLSSTTPLQDASLNTFRSISAVPIDASHATSHTISAVSNRPYQTSTISGRPSDTANKAHSVVTAGSVESMFSVIYPSTSTPESMKDDAELNPVTELKVKGSKSRQPIASFTESSTSNEYQIQTEKQNAGSGSDSVPTDEKNRIRTTPLLNPQTSTAPDDLAANARTFYSGFTQNSQTAEVVNNSKTASSPDNRPNQKALDSLQRDSIVSLFNDLAKIISNSIATVKNSTLETPSTENEEMEMASADTKISLNSSVASPGLTALRGGTKYADTTLPTQNGTEPLSPTLNGKLVSGTVVPDKNTSETLKSVADGRNATTDTVISSSQTKQSTTEPRKRTRASFNTTEATSDNSEGLAPPSESINTTTEGAREVLHGKTTGSSARTVEKGISSNTRTATMSHTSADLPEASASVTPLMSRASQSSTRDIVHPSSPDTSSTQLNDEHKGTEGVNLFKTTASLQISSTVSPLTSAAGNRGQMNTASSELTSVSSPTTVSINTENATVNDNQTLLHPELSHLNATTLNETRLSKVTASDSTPLNTTVDGLKSNTAASFLSESLTTLSLTRTVPSSTVITTKLGVVTILTTPKRLKLTLPDWITFPNKFKDYQTLSTTPVTTIGSSTTTTLPPTTSTSASSTTTTTTTKRNLLVTKPSKKPTQTKGLNNMKIPESILKAIEETMYGRSKDKQKETVTVNPTDKSKKEVEVKEDFVVRKTDVTEADAVNSKETIIKAKETLRVRPTVPTLEMLLNASAAGPRVLVPEDGLYKPGFRYHGDSNSSYVTARERHVSLYQQRMSVGTVFNRYWPAILGLTVGTVFLLAALLTSIACRQQRLFVQRRRWQQDTPQHLTEPPDTSEYASSAASSASSLASDNTRSSINFT